MFAHASPIIPRAFQVLFSPVGAFLVGLAARNVLKGVASKHWPQVQGRIVRSFVLVHQGDEGGEGFTAQVEFEYVVEGKTLRGRRLQYGRTGSWNRRRAERVLAPYQTGQSVPVLVDPRRPIDAVLIPGVAWGNVLIAGAGLIFLACAYFLQLDMK